MCDFGSFPACIFFEAAAQPFGFGHVAFAGPVAFTDNGVFHPLHVFAVLTVVALYHFVFIASHNTLLCYAMELLGNARAATLQHQRVRCQFQNIQCVVSRFCSVYAFAFP